MTFLQPWLLFALPLISIPVIIHLISRRRYQSVEWAAMLFLLSANRMTRGFARVRQWLVLASRMLAIAMLVIAASRPLASGWLGWAAGMRSDTAIILLDRSPSMAERDESGTSKLHAGLQQLRNAMTLLRPKHFVLIDSARPQPQRFDRIEDLSAAMETTTVAASADVPRMVEAAFSYVRDNQLGAAEVWICSDLRTADWQPQSARWPALREAFRQYPGRVQFRLLSYAESGSRNWTIQLKHVRYRQTSSGGEVRLSFTIRQTAGTSNKESVAKLPVLFSVGGKTQFSHLLEVAGAAAEVSDFPIPLGEQSREGWGWMEIPADANPADNRAYFVFDETPPPRVILVSDDPQAAAPLSWAASSSPDPSLAIQVEQLAPQDLGTRSGDDVPLVIWSAPLPTGESRQWLERYVNRGGQLLLFPPATPTSDGAFGIQWKQWQAISDKAPALAVGSWVTDDGLLAHTLAGRPLPVHRLEIRRICSLTGNIVPLARLTNGDPILGRVPLASGGVYVWTTGVHPSQSNLASNGVVLYVALQRALAQGMDALGKSRHVVATAASGTPPPELQPLGDVSASAAWVFPADAGVFQQGEHLIAVHRPLAEDNPATVDGEQLRSLWEGIDFRRVDRQVAATGSIIEEVWKLFVVAMLWALLAEAFLCLPRPLILRGSHA